jgi:hypothetical protein
MKGQRFDVSRQPPRWMDVAGGQRAWRPRPGFATDKQIILSAVLLRV